MSINRRFFLQAANAMAATPASVLSTDALPGASAGMLSGPVSNFTPPRHLATALIGHVPDHFLHAGHHQHMNLCSALSFAAQPDAAAKIDIDAITQGPVFALVKFISRFASGRSEACPNFLKSVRLADLENPKVIEEIDAQFGTYLEMAETGVGGSNSKAQVEQAKKNTLLYLEEIRSCMNVYGASPNKSVEDFFLEIRPVIERKLPALIAKLIEVNPRGACNLIRHDKLDELPALAQMRGELIAFKTNYLETAAAREKISYGYLQKMQSAYLTDLESKSRSQELAFIQHARFFFLSADVDGISFLVREGGTKPKSKNSGTYARKSIDTFLKGLGEQTSQPKKWNIEELGNNSFILQTHDRDAAEVVRHLCENLRGLPPEIFYAGTAPLPSRQAPTLPPRGTLLG